MTRKLIVTLALLGAGGCPFAVASASKPLRTELVFAAGDGVSSRFEIATVRPATKTVRRLTHLRLTGFDPVWTSDGRGIVFVSRDGFGGGEANWRMSRDGRRVTRLPGTGEWDAPSPDGRRVAVLGARIRIVSAAGRRLKTLPSRLRAADAYGDLSPVLWSPDGRYLAVSVSTETSRSDYVWAFTIATDGRSRQRVLGPRKNGHEVAPISWSPDSRHLLLVDRNRWLIASPDRANVHQIRSLRSHAVAWSPDSKRLAFVARSGGLFTMPSSGGRARRVAGTSRRAVLLDWSARNDLAFSDAGGIYAVQSDGHGRRRLTSKTADSLDWSPDGKRLVFHAPGEIAVVGRAGGHVRTLTRAVADLTPAWSPNHRLVAFARQSQGDASVLTMKADGSGKHVIGRGQRPRWSPDGRRLVFLRPVPPATCVDVNASRVRSGRIVVADLAHRRRRVVAAGTAPIWSPTGERIAFMRYSYLGEEHCGYEVTSSVLYTARADGTDVQVLNTSGYGAEGNPSGVLDKPAWSPDGRTIAAREDEQGIELVDTQTGAVRSFDVIKLFLDEFDWSPDSHRLAFTSDGPPHVLGVVDVTTGAERVLARSKYATYYSPTWSPDGSRVGFIRCSGGDLGDEPPCDVYAVRPDGSNRKPQRLTQSRRMKLDLDWG